MLRALNIRDFVIVDRMDLEFAPGFTVLTGETGAGKSILIDALAMVLGERGDAGIVRQGADKAEISAEFDIAGLKSLQSALGEHDLALDEETCLMRRVIDASGRSRAFINGRSVTLAQLRETGEHLVDIYGQHEHQSLMRSQAQRGLLDAYAGLESTVNALGLAWRRWQDGGQQLAALETNAAVFAAEREQLEWQVRELEALKFNADEWRELVAEHARLAHARTLIEGAQYAMDRLGEEDNSSLTQLAAVGSRLNHLLQYDQRLQNVAELIASAQAQAQEAVYMLRDYQQGIDIDPQRYSEIEQRLDAVHAVARKYRVTPEALAEALAKAQARLDEIGGAGDLEMVRARVAEARAAYCIEAEKVSAGRKKAAKKLAQKVTAAMQTLAMTGGSFEVALNPLAQGNSSGLEQIEFLVSAHEGVARQPLAKVASGGELSRISLAIQAVTSELAEVPTLVFDEVDAGIGGRVAEIVGQMLKQLGSRQQVMCVTHLPQVAAAADQQWLVTKSALKNQIASSVTALKGKQRVEEIARMLGGVKITETTRRHAAEMLGTGESS